MCVLSSKGNVTDRTFRAYDCVWFMRVCVTWRHIDEFDFVIRKHFRQRVHRSAILQVAQHRHGLPRGGLVKPLAESGDRQVGRDPRS